MESKSCNADLSTVHTVCVWNPTHFAILDLLHGGHQAQPEQLGSLAHYRVTLHAVRVTDQNEPV
jgi:hypothetical protein